MTPSLLSQFEPFTTQLMGIVLALQPAASPGGGGGGGHGGGGGGQGNMLQMLVLPLMFVFVYFVMLRPMKKQQQEQEQMQKGLRPGDKVVTTSGIIGTVIGLADREVTLEISEKVKVKFLKDSISRKYDPNAKSADARSDAK
ncbi:MAG: preprotein translocase subunit YajC [Myxococcales bacterium]|nr:preprotein translocase subunit YajC [Myxococcales bacterium]